MQYVSTRGGAPILDFEGVLLAGLARDGGLYAPRSWPLLSHKEIAALAGMPYHEAAFAIMRRFTGDTIGGCEFLRLLQAAYAPFAHKAVAPLAQIGVNRWLLELFHGPTLSFKDIAMQALASLMDRTLQRSGRRATIVGATSGDTGGAAIEAFRGREAIDIFILYPHERVSEVQRRQMTTAPDRNVHAVAIEGAFDDCQAIVKALFNDLDFRDRFSLAAVNSINWARIMAQTVYYFTAAVALGAPGREVNFTVPTGNFGNIFAGYAARQMGLPVGRLVIAANVNDILVRTLDNGRYEPKQVMTTASPSMDIQISSNFERLLFELTGRDSGRVKGMMAELRSKGFFDLTQPELETLRRLFSAYRADETETCSAIADLYRKNGYIADPHTAVGIAAAAKAEADPAAPMVVLSTAHPAKFPAAMQQALGFAPPAPPRLRQALQSKERFTILKNDAQAAASFIAARSRAHSLSANLTAGLSR